MAVDCRSANQGSIPTVPHTVIDGIIKDVQPKLHLCSGNVSLLTWAD